MTSPIRTTSLPIAQPAPLDLLSDPRLKPLRERVGQLVGSVFYGTLLRTVHQGDSAEGYGRGGHGEKTFQAQLDLVLAEKAGGGSRNDLTSALLKRLAPQHLRVQEAHSAVAGLSGGGR